MCHTAPVVAERATARAEEEAPEMVEEVEGVAVFVAYYKEPQADMMEVAEEWLEDCTAVVLVVAVTVEVAPAAARMGGLVAVMAVVEEEKAIWEGPVVIQAAEAMAQRLLA